VVASAPGQERSFEVQLEPGQSLGLAVAEMKTRLCGNECVFCFIDQNPAGMRPTIYVKDEDYRLSFLHGNFVTLTNMKKWELERIVEQRLSPMYISVHSTTPETRRRLLRPKVDRDVLALMDYLAGSGILLHTQIVLCPGYNDGDDLERTIRDLASRWPGVRSLAIVPLGMTEHREGLVELEPVTREIAARMVEQVQAHQKRLRGEIGATFVYLADEFYRMLSMEPPPASRYDGFPQLENGIGMTRHFLDRLRRTRRLFGEATARGERVFTLVTGELFEPILRPAVAKTLERTREEVEVRIVGCVNAFFGRRVTVAGLLSGGDVARGLEGRDLGDRVFVPPATLNDDGVFLDDLRLTDLAERFGTPFEAGFFRT
jgi:putative radical SAM enzyme (TIGR03279 family)